nr:aldehyde dehydrogenase family protein [Armatimonadota bacterium]
MKSINPATGELVLNYPVHSEEQVLVKIRAAEEAFDAWRSRSFKERGDAMSAAVGRLRSEKSSLAQLITTEMGKPIDQAEAEIEKCAWGCEYYAEHAARCLAFQETKTDASFSGVAYQPLGAILAIMPWNFPFWQVFRFAAPALMAGNVAVLKHASNVPGCAVAIEKIFSDAGFPPGVFSSLLVESSAIEGVIGNPAIKAVALTGSDKAGRSVAAAAGAQIKKTVLELGGSDPFIVLADAELEQAVAGAVQARTQNAGQSCIAAKRFIVDKRIESEFTKRFVEAMRGLKVGDPMD